MALREQGLQKNLLNTSYLPKAGQHVMRKWLMVITGIMALSLANNALATLSSDETIRFNKTDAGVIKRLMTQWTQRCSRVPKAQDCMLRESDVFPGSGRPTYVLLFRGEPASRIKGSSALFAFSLRHRDFCGEATCDTNAMSRSVILALDKMRTEAPMAICGHSLDKIIYDLNLGTWSETETASVLGNVCRGEPIAFVASEHKTGGNRIKIKSGADSLPFDPFISLSENPGVALQYAINDKNGKGRFLVLSVDEKRIPVLADLMTDSSFEGQSWADKLYRFPESSSTYAAEREIDAFNQLPAKDYKFIFETEEGN